MSESMLSLGLDVGTTTTQLIFSRLTVENRSTPFSVPKMEITHRQILYRSPVYFTPLLGKDLVDGEKLRDLVIREYEKAGVSRQDVDTGAVIVTGETSRKENARTVLESLSRFAGDFVVATAGPDLESVLAAKGAGAVKFSEESLLPVLHIDIGGGTSNLALCENGRVVRTGCINAGGRVQGVSVEEMVSALEMAAGLRPATELLSRLQTREAAVPWVPPEGQCILSFSGGVADCIETLYPDDAFGDRGPALGRGIRNSRLCAGTYRLGTETVGATVIGAGCHSTTLSGSTVFHRGMDFPLQNLPVVTLTPGEQDGADLPRVLARGLAQWDTPPIFALPGYENADYRQVRHLAQALGTLPGSAPVMACFEGDMAKAVGHALCLDLPRERPVLILDRVALSQGDYLDVGAPLGPALPVVVKTLVLGS